MNNQSCLCAILRTDPVRWHLLGVVAALGLPDCWIGAGFVRNAVWDHLHQQPAAPPGGDVDVIWYDRTCPEAEQDRTIEARLQTLEPSIHWSVKNQARMHHRNGDAPYTCTSDAMRYWPETATAVAARRGEADMCEIAAPLGLDDLFGLTLRPTAHFHAERRPMYEERIKSKGWLENWPLLRHADA
ncbi:nucleotidyltransferase family protein [Novosphingobium clariflavum]|uniref:Nucleotidyltransferase family protein n=1 Tax=Novosphingobium clariflavum TaxID=2029884 RepID=A0ABV6S4F6_9SPHN|nr:nucleotidyltransferase family protein [Novosphingobium clariflavum]